MKRLALFFSGTGGNALNLLAACREGRIPARVVAGVASTPKAGGIPRLEAEGVPVRVALRSAYPDDAAYSAACYALAEAEGADAIALCGWLKKLDVPPRWEGRILNIHPALLPAFGGAGMWGMHVHRAVLAAGRPVSGATVHWVDDNYDTGAVIAQVRVPVERADGAESLAARVQAAERELVVEVLGAVASGRLKPPPQQPASATS